MCRLIFILLLCFCVFGCQKTNDSGSTKPTSPSDTEPLFRVVHRAKDKVEVLTSKVASLSLNDYLWIVLPHSKMQNTSLTEQQVFIENELKKGASGSQSQIQIKTSCYSEALPRLERTSSFQNLDLFLLRNLLPAGVWLQKHAGCSFEILAKETSDGPAYRMKTPVTPVNLDTSEFEHFWFRSTNLPHFKNAVRWNAEFAETVLFDTPINGEQSLSLICDHWEQNQTFLGNEFLKISHFFKVKRSLNIGSKDSRIEKPIQKCRWLTQNTISPYELALSPEFEADFSVPYALQTETQVHLSSSFPGDFSVVPFATIKIRNLETFPVILSFPTAHGFDLNIQQVMRYHELNTPPRLLLSKPFSRKLLFSSVSPLLEIGSHRIFILQPNEQKIINVSLPLRLDCSIGVGFTPPTSQYSGLAEALGFDIQFRTQSGFFSVTQMAGKDGKSTQLEPTREVLLDFPAHLNQQGRAKYFVPWIAGGYSGDSPTLSFTKDVPNQCLTN